MKSPDPFEVIGIPKEIVQKHKTDGTLEDLLKHAERVFAAHSRFLHPDVNTDPVMGALYVRMVNAIEELRSSAGMDLALRWFVGENDRATQRRHKESQQEAATQRESLVAVLGLLRNISQFRVMGVTQPTSVMLQFGASRTILDIVSHERTFLSLSATESSDELPEQSEKPEYVNGHWSEQYLNHEGVLKHYEHQPERFGKVDIVGFVPASAKKYHDNDDVLIYTNHSELGEGLSGLRMTPSWTSPETAWFLRSMVEKFTKHADVVVRHSHSGHLALVGTIQASATIQRSSSNKI